MHFLLTLIHIPEIQLNKLNSILCECILSYFKCLFRMDSYRLCGPVLKTQFRRISVKNVSAYVFLNLL